MKKPKVVVDARMVGPTKHGIGNYVSDIARALIGDRSYELIYLVTNDIPKEFPWTEVPTVVAKSPFLHPMEWLEIPFHLKAIGADLYHSPSFASLPYSPCPWIITVHDLNHLQFGDFSQKLYYNILLRRFSLKARGLLTVSEFARKEIHEWLNVDSKRIEVVYNVIESTPVDPERRNSILEQFGLREKGFYYCLSNAKPHKNLGMLVQAYQKFRSRFGPGSSWPLVLSIDSNSPLAGNGVMGAGILTSEEAAVLSGAAAGCFFPSLYEGFGRPPAEAVLAGAPIVVSDIPPHREVLSTLSDREVTFLPPTNITAWAEAFQTAGRGALVSPTQKSIQSLSERFHLRHLSKSMDRIYSNMLGISS